MIALIESMDSTQKIEEKLKQLLHSQDDKALTSATVELTVELLRHDSFPGHIFYPLLRIVSAPQYASAAGVWRLIKIFADNWELLSQEQKNHLFADLCNSFPVFEDWMCCFVAAEIIGRHFNDARGLKIIKQLRAVSPDLPRALIPHGLETFIRSCQDQELKHAGILQLEEMQNDESGIVRAEVTESLSRLRKIKSTGEMPS
jgi:hypothetical protein